MLILLLHHKVQLTMEKLENVPLFNFFSKKPPAKAADIIEYEKSFGDYGNVEYQLRAFLENIRKPQPILNKIALPDKENLLFVNPVASDKELLDALYKSSCQNLLERADKGIDTVIGEGGLKLSGGEKQRLSIARSLLRHPHLLIFDEATSSLDSITEEEITSTIKEVSEMKEQITVLIAHRLSTIMHADRIYVLEKGRIVETGSHYELLDEKGLYYAMWRQQIGERKFAGAKQSA